MKSAIACLFLLSVLFTQSYSAESIIQFYSGSDFIGLFDLFKNSAAYINGDNLFYGSKSVKHGLQNVTGFACNTDKNKCILAVDFVFKEFALEDSTGNMKETGQYKIREQTSFRIHSQVAFIEGSDYFLTSSLLKYGVNRWKFGEGVEFAQLNFPSLSSVMECTDILVIPKSKFALISFGGSDKIPLIDFVNMNEIRMISGLAGVLAPLSLDSSQGYFLSAAEQVVTKYSFTDGTTVGSLRLDYIVTGMKNVYLTDLVIISTWESFYVYNFAGTSSATWAASTPYYYRFIDKQLPGGVKWDQMSAVMFFSGLGHLTTFQDSNPSFCHPLCNGCTYMLSDYKCSACNSPATLDGTTCKLPADQIKSPPGGFVDYTTAKWSENNKKTAPPEGFNIKDYYLYIIIGAGGLVGLCCICCICKMCCKKDDEQRNNKVGQQKDY